MLFWKETETTIFWCILIMETSLAVSLVTGRTHCGLALTLQLITICPSLKLFNLTQFWFYNAVIRFWRFMTNCQKWRKSDKRFFGGFRQRFCKTCVMLFLLRIKTVFAHSDRRSSLFSQPNTGNRDRTIRLRRIDERSKLDWAQLFLACVETDTSSPEFWIHSVLVLFSFFLLSTWKRRGMGWVSVPQCGRPCFWAADITLQSNRHRQSFENHTPVEIEGETKSSNRKQNMFPWIASW